MKKLLYFVVSVLSLGIIFGAGWASGVGTINRVSDSPAALIEEDVEECPNRPDEEKYPNGEKCPEHGFEREKDIKLHRHGFRMKVPFPPIYRNDIIRLPKTVS